MKKIVKCLMVSVLSIATFLFTFIPISAEENVINIIETEYGTITEVDTGNPHLKKSIVEENGIVNIIEFDYLNMTLKIDGEIISVEYSPIITPFSSTVNWSSAVNAKTKIPWKGTVSAMAVAIGYYFTGVKGVTVSMIASFLTSELSDVWITYTQYRSNESYYSEWNGYYYNQYIWKNIRARWDSADGPTFIGPYDGAWYDPIRP